MRERLPSLPSVPIVRLRLLQGLVDSLVLFVIQLGGVGSVFTPDPTVGMLDAGYVLDVGGVSVVRLSHEVIRRSGPSREGSVTAYTVAPQVGWRRVASGCVLFA